MTNLLDIGSWGYQVGAIGVVSFTILFLGVVRWWSDLLGRVLAFLFCSTSAVLLVGAYRSLTGIESDGFLTVRAVIFWVFGGGVWFALGTFLWAQFYAPRIKHRATRRDKQHVEEQESGLAAPGSDRDGDSHDRAGSHR